MIRIEVEIETNDPALRDYVLGDVESWRGSGAMVSHSIREEDEWAGGAKTVRFSQSIGFGVVAEIVEDPEPSPPSRLTPPRFMPVEEARNTVEFPVYVIPSLAASPRHSAIVHTEGGGAPPSVVITYVIDDERGRQRGNVWVTSSAELIPAGKFEAWRTVEGHDVCEDRSGGYYRCKVRAQISEASFAQIESTGHRTLDQVLALLGALRTSD